jgi:CRP-like cAMP-binding protein
MPKNHTSYSPPGNGVSADLEKTNQVSNNSARANGILAALSKSGLETFANKLRPFSLEFGEILYEPDWNIEYVYFPMTGVISLLAVFEDGGSVEAGLLGAEGMLGASIALGAEKMPFQALVQSEGQALRMSAHDLKSLIQNDGALLDGILRFTNALFTQVAQTAACNRAHTLEQRLARWLLLTHDRVKGDEFQLTQDFLSRMLGVRRAGVSVAANALREMRTIDYKRGTVRVLDRTGLERVSCECYQVVKAEYDRVLKA